MLKTLCLRQTSLQFKFGTIGAVALRHGSYIATRGLQENNGHLQNSIIRKRKQYGNV